MSLSLRNLLNSPHSIFGGFGDDLLSEMQHFPHPDFTAVPFLTNITRDPDMVLRRSSPCYEITENEKQFQLALDVPGVKMKDMTIDFNDKDRVLHISGGRKVRQEDQSGNVKESESKFEKRFVMDKSVDISKVTAKLQDGVLTITAPKNVELLKPETIKIAITEGGENPQDSKL